MRPLIDPKVLRAIVKAMLWYAVVSLTTLVIVWPLELSQGKLLVVTLTPGLIVYCAFWFRSRRRL